MSVQNWNKDIITQVPSTRYRGSKRNILPWIFDNIKEIKFETVLDGFGGTGSVSYLFKLMGKRVIFNDILQSNYQIGISIIENNRYILNKNDIKFLIRQNPFDYPEFIQKNYRDIYYLNDENEWLDMIITNINMLSQKYSGEILRKKKSLAYNALFQACLSKRPFNLFHRKNLYIRTADVPRTFYNKKIWDEKFESLFIKFAQEISTKIFNNYQKNSAICEDIINIENTYDLIYFDPPYLNSSKNDMDDYFGLYHFLEGIVDYENWGNRIDISRKNKPLKIKKLGWSKKESEIKLDKIFKNFSDSIIMMSYSDHGYPSLNRILELLYQYKKNVRIEKIPYNYSLNNSGKNGYKLKEFLIIANK